VVLKFVPYIKGPPLVIILQLIGDRNNLKRMSTQKMYTFTIAIRCFLSKM